MLQGPFVTAVHKHPHVGYNSNIHVSDFTTLMVGVNSRHLQKDGYQPMLVPRKRQVPRKRRVQAIAGTCEFDGTRNRKGDPLMEGSHVTE